jgi:serine/threonine protein kinase/tetratricopeptide (TPR) repeat protein
MSESSPAEAIFFAALERPPAERAAFLDQACAGDAGLRGRIERMLAAQSHLGGFLDPPQAPAAPDPGQTGAYAPPAEAPGAVIAGRYKLLQRIGEGGMGSVWMADQLEPVKRRVAVKLIHGDRGTSQTILARFEAERQAVALMDHPHIAKLLDAGTTGAAEAQTLGAGRPYFVMELIRGVPLNEYCDQHKLSIAGRLALFIQICSAVQHAHQKGVIHRDLKPSNVLVEAHDDRPVPKVIDFGLAKALSGQALTERTLFTAFGTVAGTPLYMAPEQAMFNAVDVDTRADIYSLGVILYELLTGTTPVEREQLKKAALDEILRLIRESEPPTPSHRLSSTATQPGVAASRQMEPLKLSRFLRGDLDWIVMKALAKERDRRYETAGGLARDIERFLAHEPVLAGPPGAWYRLKKLVRRRRGPLLAGSCVALALLGGVAAVIAVQVRANWDLTAKNDELTNEQAKVLARETQAIDAVKRFRDAVADEPELKNNPALGGLRKRLLKEPLTFFRELRDRLQADQDTQPESLARLAQASFDLGNLTGAIGDTQDALVAHRESLAIRQKLADANPSVVEYQHNLAASHYSIGKFLRETGKPAEAQKALESALALYRQLVDAHPTVTDFQDRLGRNHLLRGLVLEDTGKFAEATKAYESALAVYQKLVDAHPNVAEFQSGLAGSHNNIGVLLGATEKRAEALKALKTALAIQQKLADANPTVTQYQTFLANHHGAIGNVLEASGKLAESLKAQESALAIRQELADAHPTVAEFQSTLAGSYHDVSVLLHKTGKRAEALKALEKALAIQQKLADAHPTVTQYQAYLANHHLFIGGLLNETGKSAEALKACESGRAILQKLADAHPTAPRFREALVGCHDTIACLLRDSGKPAEAVRSFESAVAINRGLAQEHPALPDYASDLGASLNNLALVELDTKRFEEARARLREAVEWQRKALAINPANPTYRQRLANHLLNLVPAARALADAEGVAEVERELSKLAQEHPETPDYASGFGACQNDLALVDLGAKRFEAARGRLREAVRWQRKALAIDPANPTYRQRLANHLANLLLAAWPLGDTECVAEALKAQESMLASGQKSADANPTRTNVAQRILAASYNKLGYALYDKHQLDKAEAAFRSALRLDPKDALTHDWVAFLRLGAGDPAGALPFAETAVQLDGKSAQAHWNLGRARAGLGDFHAALAGYRKALEINPKHTGALYGLARVQRLAAVQDKLPAFQRGDFKPATNEERLALAELCASKKLYRTSAGLFADAFAADVKVAGDHTTGHRYNAACFATLAGAGQGKDPAKPDEGERAGLRKQALGWLRADLALWAKQLESGPPTDRARVQQTMKHWLHDKDLAPVRDAAALANLPSDERAAFAELWADVAALRKKAEEQAK